MKKKIALIIAMLFLSLGIMSGCSTAELGYLDSYRKAAALEEYTYTSTLKLDIDLQGSLLEALTEEEQTVFNNLKSFDLKESGYADNRNNRFMTTLYYKDNGSELTSFIYEEGIYYLHLPGIINLLSPAMEEDEQKQLSQALGNAEWLAFDYAALTEDSVSYYTFYDPDALTKKALPFNNMLYNYLNGVAKDCYGAFKSSLITKDGTGYVLKMDSADIYPIFLDFYKATLNNYENIASYTNTFLGGLSDDEKEALAAFNTTPEELQEMINNFLPTVKEDREKMIAKLDNPQTKAYFEAGIAYFDGSSFTNAIYPTNNGYKIENDIDLLFNDYDYTNENGNGTMEMHLIYNTIINKNGNGEISLPAADDTISYEKFADNLPVYQALEIYVQDQEYYYSSKKAILGSTNYASGDIQALVKDGHVYLPLRAVGQLFGENVGWDDSVKKAYIIVDGKRNYMNSITQNSSVFCQLREFTKLGYNITWDQDYKMVGMYKN